MTRITVTIDDKSNASLVYNLLTALKFVKTVESEEMYDTLSEDEIRMLEERVADYDKNPQNAKTWEEVKANIMKKHG